MDDDMTPEVDESTVPPSPWTNGDTVAALLHFAQNLSAATAELFHAMHLLAVGQAALDWQSMDKAEFAADADELIKKLMEGGAESG